MRFALIDGAKAEFPVHRLCRVLGVEPSGYFALERSYWPCRRQRDDMVLLAHVRSAFSLSNSTYGSPRMTRELRDKASRLVRRRIARLMRDNGLRARQKRRFKPGPRMAITPGQVAPNLLDQDFDGNGARQEVGRRHLPTCGPAKGWFVSSPFVIDLFARRGRRLGQQATGCIRDHWPSSLALRKALTMRRPAPRFRSTIRIAAASIARSTTRPICGSTAF